MNESGTTIHTASYDQAVVRQTEVAVDFMANTIQASTQYSIIGEDLNGKLHLWNEGVRRPDGYDAAASAIKSLQRVLTDMFRKSFHRSSSSNTYRVSLPTAVDDVDKVSSPVEAKGTGSAENNHHQDTHKTAAPVP